MTTRTGLRPAPCVGRAVSSGSSASTVPAPTTIASTRERSTCTCSREGPDVIHFEAPDTVASLPSSVAPALSVTQGSPWRMNLRKGRLSVVGLACEHAARHRHAGPAHASHALAVDQRVGVGGGVDDLRDARVEDGLRARRGAAAVIARLERRIERGPPGLGARGLQRHGLSVGGAGLAMPAAGDDLPALDDDRADRRVGVRGALPARRLGQRLAHEPLVLVHLRLHGLALPRTGLAFCCPSRMSLSSDMNSAMSRKLR